MGATDQEKMHWVNWHKLRKKTTAGLFREGTPEKLTAVLEPPEFLRATKRSR